MENLPWYKSAIARQSVTQILVALTAILGINLGDIDIDALVASIFASITGLIGLWTLITRFVKPAPNLTAAAANKERDLIERGEIPAKEGGFARVGLLAVVALGSLAMLSGCATTGAPGSAAGERRELAKQVLVQGAAITYIKQVSPVERAQRARRIIDAVSAVKAVAADGEITLQRLVQLATERIPQTADPADRLLAMNLIKLAQDALQGNIGVGGLESDTLLKLSEVLDLIAMVANLYVSS